MTELRAVRFSRYGGPEVLHYEPVDDAPTPEGRLRVRVEAAGLNVYDTKRRSGVAGGVRFPAGNGSDFTGVVEEVGDGVAGWAPGDSVLGHANFRAQSDVVRVPAADVVRRPPGMAVEVAGALDLSARTAADLVRAAGIGPGDVVLVSAAAGGVGVVTAQLARIAGAVVLGTAGEANARFLESLGVLPVPYGPGLGERVRRLAPSAVTAVLDLHGRETLEAGVELGVDARRILTIADREAADELGVSGLPQQPPDPAALVRAVELVAAGDLVLPVDSVFPVADVAAAYRHFEGRHLRGKVVLRL
ncbi:NADP-dependent oxidoreductase [Naasia sp. SYSU D00057]|uniref:NADP-dependent oxidoreductase n=1 Tax=Naasia sp. SYSU D00057 TaxID=2817380 RepID=UPI001B31422F|nr:NADP-dependent oxidoreductase [Naasia sp. SYSU D00057]